MHYQLWMRVLEQMQIFIYNLGYTPVIKRVASFGCCKWCRDIESIAEYEPRMDRNIFRRHAHCRCKVIYDPGDCDVEIQNVWSKNLLYF